MSSGTRPVFAAVAISANGIALVGTPRTATPESSITRSSTRASKRITRDHFTAIADEHHRSLADSVIAAQKAANMFASERDRRVQELRRDLQKVDALSARARSIDGVAPAAASAPGAASAPAIGAGPA
jgi:hypothetical protein